jgi:ATP-binding cassette subfamily C (CFTR/MRP) protein 1
MLGHMKGIKMSGLSQKLSNTISKLRLEEIQAASPFRIVMAISSGVSQIPQLISPVAAFAFFAIKALRSDETFDVTKIFVSLSLVILLSAPLFTLSQFVLELNAAIGCFSRIEKFLSTGSHTDYRRISGRVTQSEDTEKENGNHHVATNIEDPSLHSQEKVACTPTLTAESRGEKNIVKIRDASFSWSKEDATLVKTVNLVLKKGQMAMIVGPVASGKTTFLKGLLGEVPVATGEVKIIGNRVAWCEPSPWLTVRSMRNLKQVCLY